jgi:hypothetical protein
MHRLHIVIHPTDLETFTDAAFALAQKRIPGIDRGQVVARWHVVFCPHEMRTRAFWIFRDDRDILVALENALQKRHLTS